MSRTVIIRAQLDEDIQLIDDVKNVTGRKESSKALMDAARKVVSELPGLKREIEQLREERDEYRAAYQKSKNLLNQKQEIDLQIKNYINNYG